MYQCTGDTLSLDVLITPTGVHIPVLSGPVIYPNPFKLHAIAHLPDEYTGSFTLIIQDLNGKIIKKIQNLTGPDVNINLENQSPGVYILEITGSRSYRGKLIKY